MNILSHISESLVNNFELKMLEFFAVDPDPGSDDFDPGSGINISAPHSCMKHM
jgi:hypothetical protein